MDGLPIALPINQQICTRCNSIFTRDVNIKPGGAQYYRCAKCLSMRSVITDTIYSCIIM